MELTMQRQICSNERSNLKISWSYTHWVEGMDTGFLIALIVWLIIGVVIGGWISIDTFRRKVKGAKWVAIGVILSVVGLAIYLIMRNRNKTGNRTEHRSPPEY